MKIYYVFKKHRFCWKLIIDLYCERKGDTFWETEMGCALCKHGGQEMRAKF
jgi:hypothetical protein